MNDKQMEIVAKYVYYLCLYLVGRKFGERFKGEYIGAKGELDD